MKKYKKKKDEASSMVVEIFEQAYTSRCYGVVIMVKGEKFSREDEEFFPDANYNYLPLPTAQKKAAEIAILLGQKRVEVDSDKKELTYKTLKGIKFTFKKKEK